MAMIRLMPAGAGPCLKQTVTATIVALDGSRYQATNHVLAPQSVCPRAGLATGVGYELCRDICRQPAHAEINALDLAGDACRGGTLYLTGHTYACEPCKDAARRAGVTIVIGPAPTLGDDMTTDRITKHWPDCWRHHHGCAVARIERSGWQPIATAPKDGGHQDDQHSHGPYVLLCADGNVIRGRWWQSRTRIDSSNFIADGGWACFPTHWQPLPQPPKDTP
jgi:hypothetical protein